MNVSHIIGTWNRYCNAPALTISNRILSFLKAKRQTLIPDNNWSHFARILQHALMLWGVGKSIGTYDMLKQTLKFNLYTVSYSPGHLPGKSHQIAFKPKKCFLKNNGVQ